MRRPLFILLAVLALAAPASPAAAADARRAMAQGLTQFEARDYEEAARSFEQAAARAAAEGLEPAAALYDQGCALLKAGNGPAAAAAFAEASRSSDPGLRAKAQYNRGIALAKAAEDAEAAERLEAAVGLLGQALEAYESAMRAEPDDEDPKVNHELAARKQAQLEQRLRDQKRQGGSGGQPPPAQERTQERAQSTPPQRPETSGNEMKPDEARTMLDAMKQQEMSQRGRVRPPRGESSPVDKAW